jgi:iron complex outermembrane receptor protein
MVGRLNKRKRFLLGLACAAALALGPARWARGEDEPAELPGPDLTTLSLEDLLKVPVTSVSRHAQTLADSPAAVTVITAEDIRRSNIFKLPELLRLAPGLDVGQINASHWAISSRGFNEFYANKLLVMMDGRTVYTPLFSGVYWDSVDYILPDLNHIEVIRGPGSTLWGANAVNGVISITTKSARDTQGFLFDGVGSTVESIGGVRYGGKIDDNTYYRVYAKYSDTRDFDLPQDSLEHDGWDSLRSGFRIDRYIGDSDTLTLQGDIFSLRDGQTVNLPILLPPFQQPISDTGSNSGGNVLARWTHVISSKSDFSVQFYYDKQQRQDIQIGYSLDTYDLDIQHRFELAKNNQVIWGMDFRYQSDELRNGAQGEFDPSSRGSTLISGFVQDDISLVPDRFHFIVGTKLETNSYSGFEVQPSARVLWTPNDRNSVWSAVSRSVRTPSRWEEDSKLVFATTPTPTGLPAQVDTIGHTSFESEEEMAYEVGYRVMATSTLSIDATAFYNSYDKLRSGTVGAPEFQPTPMPHLLIPINLGNEMSGETYGVELAANWNVTPEWRLSGSYSFLDVQLRSGFGVDPSQEHIYEGVSPRNQAQLHSYYDVTKDIEINASAYYVDHLATGDIPSYVRVDAGVTWRPTKNIDVTLGVQNLLDPHHPEFNSGLFFNQPTEVPRTFFGQLIVKF